MSSPCPPYLILEKYIHLGLGTYVLEPGHIHTGVILYGYTRDWGLGINIGYTHNIMTMLSLP